MAPLVIEPPFEAFIRVAQGRRRVGAVVAEGVPQLVVADQQVADAVHDSEGEINAVRVRRVAVRGTHTVDDLHVRPGDADGLVDEVPRAVVQVDDALVAEDLGLLGRQKQEGWRPRRRRRRRLRLRH